MRKFTLFIASLFLALGAMAQTFVEPVTGKYYKIKGDSQSFPWVTANTNSSGSVAVSANEADAAVFEKTANGFKAVSTGKYLGYTGGKFGYSTTEITVELVNTGSQANNEGKYAIRSGGNWMYNNNTDGIVHESSSWLDIERLWGFIEVVMEEQPALISRNDWSVAASSQETSGDPGQATNAIDGSNSTFWHTVYAETYPHWIEFDMKKTYNVYSFDYVSRFDNTTSNGNILNYKLYISDSEMNGNYENATLAASGTFVYGQGVNHLIELASPVAGRYVALVAESGTRGNWAGNAAANAANCAEFNVYGIEKKAATNEEKKEELRSKIEWVIAFDQVLHMIGDAVGQYSSSNDDFYHDFVDIQTFCDDIREETSIEAIEEKITELERLIATFSPNMPVNGKAYTFKNVQKDGVTVCWFKYNNSCIELTTNEDEATAFICRSLGDNKYAFTMNAGKYMIWRGSSAGYYGNKGVSESFDAYADFIINKMTTHTNFEGDFSTTRYMTIQGHRNNNNKDEYNNYVIKKNNGNPIFDQAVAPFYNDNFSSAFIMDEVEYANKPRLNAVGTSALLTSDLHNKAMATFSAPFPTVAPADVKAYYATTGNGYISLQEITGAIPANTGVILVGENANNAIMVPAAGETIATVENNALAHSAGANVEISGGYILTAKGGVAGFYKATTGTLAMNKAYIAVNGIQESVEVRFPGTTGIDDVEVENEVKAIYDLTGRRIEAITAPGIYIVNGKKVLVK